MTPADFRAFRARLGLSQTGLAAQLGVTQNTISRWERGEMEIANPTMLRLALERLEQQIHEPRPPSAHGRLENDGPLAGDPARVR